MPRAVLEIPLTRGFVTLIDLADYERVSVHRWHVSIDKDRAYASRVFYGKGHVQHRVGLHTFLTGFPRTDHVDGDGLNNQRSNLRPATAMQNCHNARAQVGRTSQYKGVSLSGRRAKPWRVDISFEDRQRFLGCFATETEAALVYDAAARVLHGPYASLNLPRPGEQSAHRTIKIGANP